MKFICLIFITLSLGIPMAAFAHLSTVNYVTLTVENKTFHNITCKPGKVSHGHLTMPQEITLFPNETLNTEIITAKMKSSKAKGTLHCLLNRKKEAAFVLLYRYEASPAHRISGHLKIDGEARAPEFIKVSVIEKNAYNTFGGVTSKPLIHFVVHEKNRG